MDTRAPHKAPLGSAGIKNFFVRHDGSLQKRCGYRLLAEYSSDVRAIWTGRVDGVELGYVLISNTVSRLNVKTGALTDIGTVGSVLGKADFFFYRATLYLVDGYKIYTVNDSGLGTPFGYVPLVGKDWPDTYRGAPYEPRNLLNNKGRISYVISEDPSVFLKTDDSISSIDAVFINGHRISSSKYSITDMDKTISVSDMSPGDRVEVYFTYLSSSYQEQLAGLLTSNRAIVFGGINNTRPFLWGGTKGVMYTSAFVSENSLAQSQMGYYLSDALYFPVNYEFVVGDGVSPISAVSRHYDRLLIFTENGAWMADSSACGVEDFPIMNINSSVGVISEGAAAMLGNRPCTVGKSSIYRWTSSTEELDECNAYSISAPIDDSLPEEFYSTASVFADTDRGELYFCSEAILGLVPVYSEQTGKWVMLDGIDAQRFVKLGNNVGFLMNNRLYVFDGSLSIDMPHPNRSIPISASFESNYMDFDKDTYKHLERVTVEKEGGVVQVEIILDENRIGSKIFTFTKDSRRIPTKRFKSLKIRLNDSDSQPQVIRSLEAVIR